MDTKQVAPPKHQTTGKERIFYGTYFLGQNIFYFIVIMMLQIYLTNVAGIAATSVAVLFLVVKVWDAINDPIFGILVDKIHFKSGKYLPWIRLSTFLIPIATTLMFMIPSSLPMWAKLLWAGIAYILWDTSYTICDVPIFAITTAMTDDIKERTGLISIGRFAAMFAFVAAIGLPIMTAAGMSYALAVFIFAIIGFLFMLPIGFVAKERVLVRSEESVPLKDLLQYLAKNRYLLIFFSGMIVAALTNTQLAVGTYVAVYLLGGPEMISLNMMVMMPAMILAATIVGLLNRKVDKYNMFMIGLCLTAVFCVVQYIAGYESLPVYFAISFMKALCLGITSVLMFTFTADCTEYGAFKTGTNAEGVSFAIQTFSNKMTTALSASIGMFILGALGYISGVDGNYPTQTQATIDGIWFMNTLFPIIGIAVQLAIMFFGYKMRDKDVKVMADANRGLISREQAMSQLKFKL